MKKRILSMLLLVVMLVTALPLTALTVFAETTPNYDKDDYNALYVKDGLVWAVDFFDTNAMWGGPPEVLKATTTTDEGGNEVTITAPQAVKNAILDRVWCDASNDTIAPTVTFEDGTNAITLQNGRLPVNSLGTKGSLRIVGLSTYANLRNGITNDGVISTTSSTQYIYNNLNLSYSGSGLSQVYPSYKPDRAHPTLTPGLTGSPVINQIGGFAIVASAPDLGTGGYWWTTGDAYTHTYEYVGTYLKDANGDYLLDEDEQKIVSISDDAITGQNKIIYYYAGASLDTVTTKYFEGEEQAEAKIYEEVYIPEKNLVAGGDFVYYENGKAVYTKDDDTKMYPRTKYVYTDVDQNYWKLGHVSGADVYASRYYSRTLTADEVAINHLIDLAKWYKIDITDVKALTRDSLIALANDPAVLALTFANTTATAAAVETVITAKAAELIKLQPNDAPASNETPVFAEPAYNDLYVKDGLVWAVDFFDTNAMWGGPAETLTGATAVQDAIKGRVWHNTSGGAITPTVSFKSTVTSITRQNGYLPTNDLGKEGGEVQIKNLSTYAGIVGGSTADMVMAVPGAINFAYNNICFAFTPTLSKVNAAFKNDGAYYSLSGISPSASWSNNTPAGVTLLLSSPELASNGIWWNTGEKYNYAYIGTYLKDNEGNFVLDDDGNKIISVTATTGSILTYYAPKGGLKTVTTDYVGDVKQETAAEYQNVYIPEDHLVPGTLALYQNGALSYAAPEGTPIFPDTTHTDADKTYWKVSYQTGATMYASRYYNRTLTPDEMRQNHFADLAKWYKIDLGYIKLLNESLLKEMYGFAADFTFDDATAAGKLEEKAIDLATELYDGLLDADALAVIAGYGIDVTRIRLFPDEYARMIFAALVDYIPGKVAAEIQAFVDFQVQETLDTYYSKYVDTTVYDYKDLYVRQDDLMLAADFFAAKPDDTPIYAGTSYPTWKAQYDAANVKDGAGYWKNLVDGNGAPLYKEEGGKMYFNGEEVASESAGLSAARRWLTANKEVVPTENNWSDYFDKYVWKGTNSMLTPTDISDTSGFYAHDNIRRFGDGCLKTGANNSFLVRYSYDSDDVTYQLVTKMSGDQDWQLRGFRAKFNGSASVLNFTKLQYRGYTVTGTKDNPKADKITLLDIPVSAQVSSLYSTDVTAVAHKYADVGFSYYKYTWNESTGKYDVVQVATEAESNSGGVSFFGRLDLDMYANGTRVAGMTNMPYNAGAPDSVGNGGNNTYYAIRVYRCTLTPEEIAQNHFADLAGYYGYDLGLYYRLSEEDRAVLHNRLKTLELGSPRADALKRYDTLFNELYYVFDVDTEASDLFRDLAAEYKLKIENLTPLSPLAQERIFQHFTTEEMLKTDTVAPVFQDNLERKITEVKTNRYAEAFVHNLTHFEGYQLKKEGDLGFRTLFTLNQEELQKIRGMYPNAHITIGTLLVPSALADAELVTVKAGGGVEFHADVVENTIAYSSDPAVSADSFDYKGKTAYACEYYPDDIEKKISFTNYVVIELGGEEKPIVYTVKTATSPVSEDGISLLDLTKYAKETEGMAYENIQSVMNDQEGTRDVVLSLGNGNISDYVIVKDGWNDAAVDRVVELIAEYVGITMRVVTEEEAALYERRFYIGRNCDVNYEDADLYGLTLSPYMLSLWYFTEENGEAAVDLFEELLILAMDEEIYTVETGTEYVRRAR